MRWLPRALIVAIVAVFPVFPGHGDTAVEKPGARVVVEPEDQKDVLRRLMAEPVTLFDWGLEQLDRDVASAAARTLPRRLGPSMGKPITGTIYDWRKNHVTIYLSVTLPRAARTGAACIATFADVVADMTAAAPQGPNAAGWYLLNAFKPKAHFWASRFEDVGAKLLNVVSLEVTFLPATFEAVNGDTARVRCAGKLNADAKELSVEVSS